MKASFFAVTAAWLALSIHAAAQHATIVRKAELVSSPDTNGQTVQTVERGSDLSILQQQNTGNEPWLRVSVAIPGATRNAPAHAVSGWLPAKPVVSTTTANGDEIVYGEAVDSEQQAEERGGRKGAAQDAMRLYYEVAQLFPNSPFAGESLWRSADIRRQLARADGKPLEDQYLNEVISRFPHSKWTDMAAFDLLDSQLCGDWNGLPDCPSKEAELYERYAREHPQSPKFGEAIFDAAYRLASLADMYRISGDKDKSSAAHNKALSLAQELAGNAVQGEWNYRATNLIYKLQQGIPLYGAPE